ncbi:MAG: histidine kinase, partial [Clostridia bacterium]|nr:histidine kinase [Clostridia bacterium]
MKNSFNSLLARYRAWRHTLRANFILTIVLLWVVPYIAVVSLAVYMVYDMQQTKLIDTVTISADSSEDICASRIRDAMSSSLSASYSPLLRKYYEFSVKGGDGEAPTESAVNALITEKYRYDEKFDLTVLYYIDRPDELYYTFSNTLAPTYKNIDYFRQNAQSLSLETSMRIGTDFGFFSVDDRVYMVRNLFLANYEPYAVLVMELNQENIFGALDGVAWQDSSALVIDRAVRTRGGSEQYFSLVPIEQTDGSRCVRRGNTYYVIGRLRIDAGTIVGGGAVIGEGASLSYALRLDSEAIPAQYSGLVLLLALLLLMLIPLMLVMTGIVDRKIVRPVNRLVRAAKRIEQGEWGYTISKEQGSEEFEHLTDTINHMSGQLGAPAEQMYAEELALRDAKIMALQSQINPHFLNNTLEIINWEARLGDTHKVSRMLEALGTMLEAALDRVKRPVVHLSEELVYVEAYLYIISERFGKRLEVEKRIDESLLDVMVPRLVMQPILENAVEHGVAPRHRGRIIIDISSDD